MADKAAASAAKKGYKEAEQHEKAYQQQHGVFVYGKPGARKADSARSKHVSTRSQSRTAGGWGVGWVRSDACVVPPPMMMTTGSLVELGGDGRLPACPH